jgi:hypothetical protein
MRSLMTAFIMMIGFISMEAQILFDAEEMIVLKDKEVSREKIGIKIFTDNDTTEITAYFKEINLKKNIKEFITIFEESDYKTYIYELKNNEILYVHLKNDKIISIYFYKDKDNYIEFRI